MPLAGVSLEKALAYLHELGVEAVELGTGGFTNAAHCDCEALLADDKKAGEMKDLLSRYNMSICALSCHGNPVHPDERIAAADHMTFLRTVETAKKLGVDTVVTFSGCPGDHPGARHPNWVTCPWPEEYADILQYQWDEVLIPYWTKAAQTAGDNGVRIAIEMHPGFCVYNTETMLKLREATSHVIGANFDPSHLFWQGIDPIAAIRALGDAIHYVHAKDCRINAYNVAKNGCLDTKHYGNEAERSWVFRTIGYGHSALVWKDICSALRMAGYDGAISIEHEDSLMSVNEGLEKAIAFMKESILRQTPSDMWWA